MRTLEQLATTATIKIYKRHDNYYTHIHLLFLRMFCRPCTQYHTELFESIRPAGIKYNKLMLCLPHTLPVRLCCDQSKASSTEEGSLTGRGLLLNNETVACSIK
jgi:hypothetical protein